VLTGWVPHDEEMPWGADPDADAVASLLDEIRGLGRRVHFVAADLADPAAPAALVSAALAEFGYVDALVAVHARSSDQSLDDLTAAEVDLSYAVNVRATLLLVQAFARGHDDARPGGRVVWFTSGQYRGPMAGELPYTASKGALHQLTLSVSASLMRRGITVNCIDPGPVDTGYASGDIHARIAAGFPLGRWGAPEDTARLVSWLVSDEAAWVTGQVIASDGGFRGV
jgi:3-oxoacyl-[acyl-carrier protein] reductase